MNIRTIAFGVVVLVLLYSTTYQVSFQDAISWVQATDVYSYLIMANAASDFPVERISFHFAQRWVPHFLVGCMAKLFAIQLSTAYVIANAGIVVAVLLTFWAICRSAVRDRAVAVLVFLLLALSVFSFRLYIFVPGLLADLVFVLGFALAVKGCVERRYGLVVLGLAVATLGKQMSLLVLPGVLLYMVGAWGPRFGPRSRRRAAGAMGLGLCLVIVAAYQLLVYTSQGFALPNSITPSVLFAILPWLVSDQFSISLLAEHVFRIVLPLMPFLVLWVLAPVSLAAKLAVFRTWEAWAWVLMILGPMAYAFLPGPVVQMGNQSRYMGAAMLPMAMLTFQVLSGVRLSLKWGDVLALAAVLITLSYHHRYTFLQASPVAFLIAQMVALTGLAAWLLVRKKAFISESPAPTWPRERIAAT